MDYDYATISNRKLFVPEVIVMKKLIVVFALLLTACVSKYRTDQFDAPSQPLSLSGSAYVMLARDGAYGRRTYSGSGRTVSQLLHNAVLAHLSTSELATIIESRDQALARARAKGVTYVFEPVILNWEDRATEWSGRPDRITIRISIWDAATGKKLASSVDRASSKWGTFGGDHPQDLVPHVMTSFANRVFR
jgi:hypothetical protein